MPEVLLHHKLALSPVRWLTAGEGLVAGSDYRGGTRQQQAGLRRGSAAVLGVCMAVLGILASLPLHADILRSGGGDDDILSGTMRNLMPDLTPQMTMQLCQQLRPYRPSPDLDYTAGVDARGRAVVPADLPGSPGTQAPLHQFDLPVTMETLRMMGLPTGPLLPKGDGSVGWLSLNDGQLLFNGQPLGPTETGGVFAFCQQLR